MAVTNIVKPDLPSSVIRWIGQAQTRIPPTTNATVAIPIVHDWGPMLGDSSAPGIPSGLEYYGSLQEWEGVYGNGDTAGHDAVTQAFLGMNVSDGGGAGAVITPRMATAGAAAASLTRQNTTPANAITLTAKYKGVRGNSITIVIEADPVTAANDRLRVQFNGATVEQYSYVRTDITNLAAQINGKPSRWVIASGVTSGVALTPTTGTVLAGGNDGSVVTTTEYAAAQQALENKNFGIFAPFNLTDVPTKVQLATWLTAQADVNQRPFRAVFGGAAAEAVAAAISELNTNASLRNEHIIRFGVGTFHDDVQNKDFSTAQLAPRIAGILAARGNGSALTSARLGGLHYTGGTGVLSSDLIAARDAGVTVLRRISDPEAELAVSQGVTTFISKSTPGKPYEFFSEPRIVGLLDDTLMRINTWGNSIVIGDLTVTDDTRREVGKEVKKILDEYETTGLAQAGSGFVNVFNTDNDPSLSDTIPYQFGFKPARTANYLVGEGRIS